MSESKIENLMSNTIENIKQIVDSDAIIGKPIIAEDGTTVIPVSKLTYGFGSGGSDFSSKNATNKDLFGGGGGAGVTVSPVGFLVIAKGEVKMIQIEPFNNSVDRIIEAAPEIIDKVVAVFKGLRSDRKKKRKEEKKQEAIDSCLDDIDTLNE